MKAPEPTMTAAEEAEWREMLLSDRLFPTVASPQAISKNKPRLRSRAVSMVEPDYRLCRFCKIVWNTGRDECPTWLMSMKELAMLRE